METRSNVAPLPASLARGLNAAQREAVACTDGPLLVLAGAGTGKTRVITFRIAHLLHRGVPPDKLLAVTFTNKAAREMRERVSALLGRSPEGLILLTFHALGMRILRADAARLGLRPNFTIYDSSDQVSLLRTLLRDIRGGVTPAEAQSVHRAISLAKNRFETPEDALEAAEDDHAYLVARAYARYQEHLRALNAVDFDDLILLPVRLLEENEEIRMRCHERFRFLLIDEYQDTSGSQYRFTRVLVGPERNVCAVGDDDQSIYGFRGAEMDKILRFEKDFPGARVVKLEENYRSTGAILGLANAVISANSQRHPKELRATLGPGEPVDWVQLADGDAEVGFVAEKIREFNLRDRLPYRDMAVLLRSGFQARPFEEKFRLQRIPYVLVGGQSYFDRKEIRDALAYWNAVHNPRDDVSLLRVINFPSRGFGPATLEKIDSFARAGGLPLQEAVSAVAGGAGDFPPRARASASGLREAIDQARALLDGGRYGAMCRSVLDGVGYRQALRELYPEPLAQETRWAAIEQLLRSVDEWEKGGGGKFAGFLSALTLEAADERRDDDAVDGKPASKVLLMTLHSAKGLEFPVVFVAGVEEDTLPHHRSVADGDRAVEEERRLFYVGVTRARKRLFLLSAAVRSSGGPSRSRLPSRFLTELSGRDLFRTVSYDPRASAGPESAQYYAELYRSHRGEARSEARKEGPSGAGPDG